MTVRHKDRASLSLVSPHLQWAVRRRSEKVVVGCQQRQSIMDAKLREDRVYGAYLYARSTAAIAKFRSIYVILSIGSKQRQGREPGDDFFARARASESLQQFLQHETRCCDDFAPLERVLQHAYFRDGGSPVAT
jgi:hypothetical protein